MKLDKHGLKIEGVKKCVSEIPTDGYYSGKYAEVFYNIESGDVWALYQYSLGQNSYTVFDDENIVKIGNYCDKTSMQQICDDISMKIKEVNAMRSVY